MGVRVFHPIDQPTRHWWQVVAGRFLHSAAAIRRGGPRDVAAAVREACLAIRLGCFEAAEAALESAGDEAWRDAAWLNLRGVVRESSGDWRGARRFYGKSMRCDRAFAPAEQNMRRWYEMSTFGRTHWPVALGDDRACEPDQPGLAETES